jgi:hypothetical protein
MKRLLFALVAFAGTGTRLAAIDTDPSKDYKVTPEAGTWMICAACYVGPQAPELAHELIMEIRSRFNLPAWVINRGEEERRKQEEEIQRLEKLATNPKIRPDLIMTRNPYDPSQTHWDPLRHMRRRIDDQCAVLVGGYKDMETASRALKDFKKLQPSSERLMPVLTQMVPKQSPDGQAGSEIQIAHANPFANSFVTRNPAVPNEQPTQKGPDPLWKKLNAHESYSLLKNRKNWTLVVAVFQGLQVIEPTKEVDASWMEKLKVWNNLFDSSQGEMLDASGHNAHLLAEALRKLPKGGYEAYVLHTRWGSIVTVGGFDRVDDPQMKQFQQALSTGLRLGQDVHFLQQFMPMEVPHF